MKRDKCESIIERDSKVIAPCIDLRYFPLAVERYDGAVITDADGNEFIDFLCSSASMNLGGNHPAVNKAIHEQLDRYPQFNNSYVYNERTVEYAERITSVYPGGVKVKVVFGNCGSDANEAAIKFSRAFTGRQKIIAFLNAYHGTSYGAATMTTCTDKVHENMGPFLPGIYSFPFYGIDVDDETCERECTAAIEQAFASDMPANEVAAVIIEPIQGDAGILPAHPIFMKKLHELCQEHGILFISEEVQQGFYRTGKFFGIEHYDIIPDGIIMGKSIGAGLTLGGFMARDEIMDCLPAPAHAFSLAGNALACAAGSAAFDVYRSDEFQAELKRHIDTLWDVGEGLKKEHPDMVKFVRGKGMSMGIGVCDPNAPGDREADRIATYKVLFRAYEKGLVMMSLAGDVLRVQPPLIITDDQIREGFRIIGESMDEFKKGLIGDEVLKYQNGW